MIRKHSYRELAKRRFAKNILFYLQDPEDAKTIFEYTGMNPRDRAEIERAFRTAESLKQQKSPNLKMYSPYIKEIERALTGQPTLF